MYEEYLGVLSKSILFDKIAKTDLNLMMDCLKPKILNCKKNGYIAMAGSSFEGLGIVMKGEAAVIKENAAGNRVMMAILKPGDMFGEMITFSSKSVWPATVQAQTACSVLFLSRQKIIGECDKICPWHKMLIQNMLKIISEKALMLNKKVEYLTIKSIRGKISTFLFEQYKKAGKTIFMLPMKRHELADFLNVSRPSMSREMCHMRDEGIIDFHMKSIRILDVEALKSAVE